MKEMKKQIVELRQELEASKKETSRLQKKLNTLQSDYYAVEDELTETKKELMNIHSTSEQEKFIAENMKLKTQCV